VALGARGLWLTLSCCPAAAAAAAAAAVRLLAAPTTLLVTAPPPPVCWHARWSTLDCRWATGGGGEAV